MSIIGLMLSRFADLLQFIGFVTLCWFVGKGAWWAANSGWFGKKGM